MEGGQKRRVVANRTDLSPRARGITGCIDLSAQTLQARLAPLKIFLSQSYNYYHYNHLFSSSI